MSRGWSRAFRTIFAALSLTGSPSMAALFGTHRQTRPKVPSPSGPWPTSEYLSSNSDDSLTISSESPELANKFEQLSSRTSPPSVSASPVSSGRPPSASLTSGSGSPLVTPSGPPIAAKSDFENARLSDRKTCECSERTLMDGRRSRMVGANKSAPSASPVSGVSLKSSLPWPETLVFKLRDEESRRAPEVEPTAWNRCSDGSWKVLKASKTLIHPLSGSSPR
mmetsp:Transcript_420/g.1031  ORF Transcript_420/g.1031 Transcript_420/m.1031 type:complete len:223 (+) Transcript_420:820-1488(+)